MENSHLLPILLMSAPALISAVVVALNAKRLNAAAGARRERRMRAAALDK